MPWKGSVESLCAPQRSRAPAGRLGMANASASRTVLELMGISVMPGPSCACVCGTDQNLIPFRLWNCSPSSSARHTPAQHVASLTSPEQKPLARPAWDGALVGAKCPMLEQKRFEFLPVTCGVVTTQSPVGLTPSHCLTGKRKLSEIHSVK